jgi:peptidoglycan lytic transglycosylase G
MIDDLDLAFDDHDEEKGRHRRGRRGAKKRPAKRRGRSWLALFVTLILLGGLGFGGYLGFQKIRDVLSTPDYTGNGTDEVVMVEVKQGETLADIARTLKTAGVVKSEKAFTTTGNQDALKIQPGFYNLRREMSGKAAVLALLDPKNRVVNGVLVREGLMTLEIYALLADKLHLNIEDIKKAAADPVKLGIPDWWFNRKDGVAPTTPKSLEGFLFPATYEFPPNVTAEGALKIMVNKFLNLTGGLKFADKVQNDRHISPYEALITASIVEAEVNKPDDMGKVARAIYNRAYAGLGGTKLLQVDAAINYWLKLQGKDPVHSNDLLRSELDNPNNPYNTHRRPGLTPTPIGSPGEVALKAAMDPPAGNWIFWVTVDKQGTTLFADNLAQHEANIRLGCQNGYITGSACG